MLNPKLIKKLFYKTHHAKDTTLYMRKNLTRDTPCVMHQRMNSIYNCLGCEVLPLKDNGLPTAGHPSTCPRLFKGDGQAQHGYRMVQSLCYTVLTTVCHEHPHCFMTCSNIS